VILGQLIDIILIAAQVVIPSDVSDYAIDNYGTKVFRISDGTMVDQVQHLLSG
jgi:hypothetical protein